MKFKKSLSTLLVLILLFSIPICNTTYGQGTDDVTIPTPTPYKDAPSIIDNSSVEYTEKGEWLTADGGVNGSYRYSTKMGSSATWRFKVEKDGYYDITALLAGCTGEVSAKYTVFYNDTFIDSFYTYQYAAATEILLRKDYGKFIEFKKDNWVTVMVKSVSEGKCVADAISFERLFNKPTPRPTAPAGYSYNYLSHAKNCELHGFIKENDYVSASQSGDYIVMKNILLSGFAGHDSTDIFTVNAAVEGSNNKLEIRFDSPEGPLLGNMDLKNTNDGSLKFCEQVFRISPNADFKRKDVYIIYKGEGKCYFDWFKFTSPEKVEPQTETLEVITPTSTPSDGEPIIISAVSCLNGGYGQKGEWYAVVGSASRYTASLGSYVKWAYKVQKDGYYDITALIPGCTNDELVKYTVFYNDTYIDSFYVNQSKEEILLRKNYGKFMEYKKDNWITVLVEPVSGGCFADAMSFKRLPNVPTPLPTAPAGFSKPTLRYAKDCDLHGLTRENNYVSLSSSGDYIVLKDVLLSGFNGFDSSNIFSVNAAVLGSGNKNLEIRFDSLEGPILGSVDLKNTEGNSSKLFEQAYILDKINAEFQYRDVYIIFKGEGVCYLDWVKFSSPSKVEPAQTEILEVDVPDKFISGYVKPGFDTKDLKSYEFRIEVPGTNLGGNSNYEGQFSLNVGSSKPVSIKIAKSGYLTREISGIEYVYDIAKIGTKEKPIEIWPGDFIQDGAINMKDIMEIAKVFNSVCGDSKFRLDYDINGDYAINMTDVIIVARYFNKTTASYDKEF